MNIEEISLTNNKLANQFETLIDNQKVIVQYSINGDRMFLTHTEVPENLEGNGIGGATIERVLQYIDEHNMRLVPLCSFVKTYVKKHSEWRKLLVKGLHI